MRLSGQSKETGPVIYLAFIAKVANIYLTLIDCFVEILARYCSKVYNWDPGHVYMNQKAKVSMCIF